ncbi:MAG: iron-sulfur cluster assembly scaffold protein [Deltaproteobacteria bacterium]|nr:iron-sulfur cluster assembly scaffold protein [Deltaproteobacteria bacterium]
MGDEWKQLYRKPEERPPQHTGPLIFYNDLVIDHFTNPRNVGEMENPDGEAVVGDPSCGDQMKVDIKIDANKIVDIKFKSYGCPGAIATSSMMTQLAKGKTLDEAQLLTDDDVVIALGGVPERKRHCSLMGVTGLLEAIKDYLKKQNTQTEIIDEKSVS